MLKSQIVKGNNGLKKSKYVTFTVEADNLEQATSKLERLEIDILSSLKSMGVRAESLNGEERLKILHDVLNPNKTFEFSYKDLKKRKVPRHILCLMNLTLHRQGILSLESLSERQVIFKSLQVSFPTVCLQSFWI